MNVQSKVPGDFLEAAATPAERRLIVVSGICFLLLLGLIFFFANILPSPGYPSPFNPSAEIERFFSENRAQVRVQSLGLILAGIALLGFVASLVGFLRRITSQRAALLWVAFGGGLLASGFAMLSAIFLWTLSRPETAEVPSLLRALHDLTYLAGGPAHVISISVFIGASSAAILDTQLLPLWVLRLGIWGAALSSLAVVGMVWEPATFILVASRGILGIWMLAVLLPLVSERLAKIIR